MEFTAFKIGTFNYLLIKNTIYLIVAPKYERGQSNELAIYVNYTKKCDCS